MGHPGFSFGFIEGAFGFGVEIDALRQLVLLLESGNIESEQRLLRLDQLTTAFPVGSMEEVSGSLLQGIEEKAGIPGIEGVVGETPASPKRWANPGHEAEIGLPSYGEVFL